MNRKMACNYRNWNVNASVITVRLRHQFSVQYVLWRRCVKHNPYASINCLILALSDAYTVYPKKYAHCFVVLCFVVVMQSFIMNSHEVFIHIHQGCFAGTGAIVRLPQCQWSKPDGYGKISQCITTTKHSKAKTVCIFLGIYCMLQETGPSFAQIMVCCLRHNLNQQRHDLNQQRLIINYTLENTFQWNLNQNAIISIPEFENMFSKMVFFSSRPQCVKCPLDVLVINKLIPITNTVNVKIYAEIMTDQRFVHYWFSYVPLFLNKDKLFILKNADNVPFNPRQTFIKELFSR